MLDIFVIFAHAFRLAGESLLFAWPNKSNQKKGHPTKLACGFSALLGFERACGTRRYASSAPQTVLGLIAQILRYSTAWKGEKDWRSAYFSGFVVWLGSAKTRNDTG
ncbi:hypothetical protein [Halopseudomonas sabulinigri]|uniref:hypothetical protein n=1 Tax=Halopseudomonas sabulinigri TaxID=472181 RepID=UPI0012FD86A4|nr:hypothetical protein [Halopseudomonas sabulinigri]